MRESAAAAVAAKARKVEGYVLPLQNTTQQPELDSLRQRSTRQTLFENSWNRAENGGAERHARYRFPAGAASRSESQTAGLSRTTLPGNWKTRWLKPGGRPEVHGCAGAGSDRDGPPMKRATSRRVIDSQKGGFKLEPWDWNFYSEQVRKAKYDMDESEIKPYFELNNVLENGVFYAATQLYGITFKERKDIPVYNPEVRVFEVFDADGQPMALFYVDFFKRDNKNGGAWMSSFVDQSKLLGTLPVVYNVCNFSKPAPGEPALLSFRDVTTVFHEFGHALHGMFADTEYPTLSGTAVARDFVEFPSQFNEHWATYPAVFSHYAKHYKTGAPMPAELAAKIKKAETFNQGYALTEVLAAAELDMQWHTLPAEHAVADS